MMAQRLFNNPIKLVLNHADRTKALLSRSVLREARRTILGDRTLRLPEFKRDMKSVHQRYGAVSTEFKTNLASHLRDEEYDIAYQDFHILVHLAEKEDIPTLLNAASRLLKQTGDEEAEKPRDDRVSGLMARKMYILNLPDELLSYYKEWQEKNPNNWYTALLTTDLLLENGRVQDVVDIATEIIKTRKAIPADFYRIVVMAAYKVGTADSVKLAATLYDQYKTDVDTIKSREGVIPQNMAIKLGMMKKLIALMCVERGMGTTAVTLLRSNENPADSEYYIDLNIMVVALLKMGKVRSAFSRAGFLIEKQRDWWREAQQTTEHVRRKYFVFDDVFKQLEETLEQLNPDHPDYEFCSMKMSNLQQSERYLINRWTLSDGILHRMAHYGMILGPEARGSLSNIIGRTVDDSETLSKIVRDDSSDTSREKGGEFETAV